MTDLSKIRIIRQAHPDINVHQPFDIAWEYQYGPMEEFQGDMHYALQLCIVLHGSMEVIFSNHRREFSAGQAYWMMFWEPHAFRFTGHRNFAVAINIELDHLGNCDPFGGCDWMLPFVVPPKLRYCPKTSVEKRIFQETGKSLFKTWNSKQANWKQSSWLQIHQLILEALRGLSNINQETGWMSEASNNFIKIKPALDMVRKSSGKPPSLKDASEICCLSQSRFSDVFKHVFHVSFGKFAARARLASAARDLAQNREMIEEIAEKWGFFDNSHFTHAFKALYGCTPKQYRENPT